MSIARPGTPLCVILVDYVVPLDAIDREMKAHVAWLERGFEEGLFVVAGRRHPRDGGVIVTRGRKPEAEALAASDPFVLAGVATVRVIEFSASFAAPEIAALIA